MPELENRNLMEFEALAEFLEVKYHQYNRAEFIQSDPISIPHQFSRKEDIEIAGFLAATIAWGSRPVILRNANRILELMDNAPFDFISNYTLTDLNSFLGFVHRTFNEIDLIYFIKSLRNIYKNVGGLEAAFSKESNKVKESITNFRTTFFELPHQPRVEKHIANPNRNSSAKRLNMFLRWMVRQDKMGVDFGLWKSIQAKDLFCPLDIHSGKVARKLGLLQRKQDDWKAVEELTTALRLLDNDDPVKYDFALFGLGVFEKF